MSLDDRLKRGLPRLAAETDPDVEPALQRVVSGGRRRKMIYRIAAVAAAVVVVGGAAFAAPRVVDALRTEAPVEPGGTPEPKVTDGRTPEPTGTASEKGGMILVQGDFECGGKVPFLPGYLPDGFSDEPIPGPAPGAFPAEEGQLVVHWTGGQGKALEVRNSGTLFAELAQEDDAPTITVLGRETADFGPVVPMEEDYIVQFTIGPKGQKCSLWSLNEYGLSLDELKRVAEGLEPA